MKGSHQKKMSYIKQHNTPKYGNLSRNFHIYLRERCNKRRKKN